MKNLVVVSAVLAIVPRIALAETTLDALLARGPVVLVEPKVGGFESATGFLAVEAEPSEVWDVLVDFRRYVEFMPQLRESRVLRQEGNQYDVQFELEVPGANLEYTLRYLLKPESHTVEVRWLDGDLEGSHWRWRLESRSGGGRTLMTYRAAVRDFSAVLESFEDERQTMTVGVNVGAILGTTRAIKRRVEARAASSDPR